MPVTTGSIVTGFLNRRNLKVVCRLAFANKVILARANSGVKHIIFFIRKIYMPIKECFAKNSVLSHP